MNKQFKRFIALGLIIILSSISTLSEVSKATEINEIQQDIFLSSEEYDHSSVEITDLTQTTVSLKWDKYDDASGYLVLDVCDPIIPCHQYSMTSNNEITLKRLLPSHNYHVQIVAKDPSINALVPIGEIKFTTPGLEKVALYSGIEFGGVYERIPEILDPETGENVVLGFLDRDGIISTMYFPYTISFDQYIGDLLIARNSYYEDKREELVDVILAVNEQEGREVFSRVEVK